MRKMTRILIVLALFGIMLFPLFASGSSAQKEEKGMAKKISILIHPTLYLATGGDTGVITQFEKDTGTEVEEIKIGPNPAIFEKLMVEFVAKTGRYDVVIVLTHWWNEETFQHLEPLDDYIAKPNPGWDLGDLIKSLVDAGKDLSGKQRTLPFRIGTSMLYYRKDILQKVGAGGPEMWDDVISISEKLKPMNIYGVGQTLYPQGDDFIRFIYSMGGNVVNRDMTKSMLDSKEGLRALEVVHTLYSKGYMPKEVLSWQRDQQIPALQNGQIAMGVFYSPYWGRIIDKKATENWDKMGWMVSPTDPGVPRGRTQNVGWGLAIDINSKHKATAWELVKRLTRSDNQLDMALNYANGPVNASVYESAEYLKKFPLSKDWLIATAASTFTPPHPRIEEIKDAINGNFSDVLLEKKSNEAGLKAASAKIDAILAKK